MTPAVRPPFPRSLRSAGAATASALFSARSSLLPAAAVLVLALAGCAQTGGIAPQASLRTPQSLGAQETTGAAAAVAPTAATSNADATDSHASI